MNERYGCGIIWFGLHSVDWYDTIWHWHSLVFVGREFYALFHKRFSKEVPTFL